MLSTLRHRVDSYTSTSVHRDFESVIEESNRAVACMDFEAFIKGGVNVFETLQYVRTQCTEMVATGKMKPSADLDEAFWEMFRSWHKRSRRALVWLEKFESDGFRVSQAAEFRNAITQVEQILSNSEFSDDELAELAG